MREHRRQDEHNRLQFDFGKNWEAFTERALTREKVDQARLDFERLTENIPLKDKTFLDIGFGQGLSLLAAKAMGAQVVGVDVNPRCVNVLARSQSYFSDVLDGPIPTVVGSILDKRLVEKLLLDAPAGYDVVHSWGVLLHHTGDMWSALEHASSLVRGYLVLALYNRHFTSPIWGVIKRMYIGSPELLKRALIGLLHPIIWLAKLTMTRKNPKEMTRGMDFYYMLSIGSADGLMNTPRPGRLLPVWKNWASRRSGLFHPKPRLVATNSYAGAGRISAISERFPVVFGFSG